MSTLVAKSPPTFSFSRSNPNKKCIPNFVKSTQSPPSITPFSQTSLRVSKNSTAYCTTIDFTGSQKTKIDDTVQDYNDQICKFCELGDLAKAMELLYASRKSKIKSSTYCSVLQLCADLKSLRDGKAVHSIIRSNEVVVEGLLGSKLVFMYVTCGDLREGRRIFDVILNEKVFLWNLVMSEYAKVGQFKESVYLFEQMRELGVEANSYSFSCVLKCLASLGSVKGGEMVHGYLLKSGFGSYDTVVNSLIAFYFKNGRVESAVKVFEELTERDIVSWNTMIGGYIANGLSREGIEVFSKMLHSETDVDLATMVSVLTGCADCETISIGRAVHGFAIKACFAKELTFTNTLLDMYSKCDDLCSAKVLFEEMGEKSVVTWTSMIAGYARKGLAGEAVKLFHEMEKEGVEPDAYTLTKILNVCALNGLLDDGKDVHEYIMKNDMQSSLFVSNALVDMYCKCGSMKDAQGVFSQMRVKDVVTWNSIIGGYSKNCLPNEALSLFDKMLEESKPDSITMACTLPACASLAALERGREIHSHILRNGYFSDRHVVNALVDMYAKCGVLLLARSLFDTIPSKDLVSWTVMIAGYGMHGLGKEAIALFRDMRKSGMEPDEVSFVSVLYACCHSGLTEEGWRFFNIMKNECNIEPKLEHYACMVDLMARTGKLSKAYNFIKTMPISPDATIWGSLLSGCRIHHDIELGEKVAERVFELEPENTGYYVLLANIYAEAEKWEQVKKLRETIGRRGLKKNPGCSWIEIKGKFNIFTAGDRSHPQLKRIEYLLKSLRVKMKEEECYFPVNIKYALINADELDKEIRVCGHSEKLAMAYGVLSLPPGKIIRVTKNLRVCGDCHEMAKFMSKVTGREIVLRDSNRFHHFKDGHCSCRGFW